MVAFTLEADDRASVERWAQWVAEYEPVMRPVQTVVISCLDDEPPRPVCGFCGGKPVADAATWLDGKPRPPAPCPRCGEVGEVSDKERHRKALERIAFSAYDDELRDIARAALEASE